MLLGWCSVRCCVSSTSIEPRSGWRPTGPCVVDVDRRRCRPHRAHVERCTATTTRWSRSRAWPRLGDRVPGPTRRRDGVARGRLGIPRRASSEPPNPTRAYRLAFGSCRRSEPFDDEHLDELGADALVALAGRMVVRPTPSGPNACCCSATRCTPTIRRSEIVRSTGTRAPRRRSARSTARSSDFEEYTWLYHEAWTTPAVRWLLSTVPTACCSTTTTSATTGTRRCRGGTWVTQQPWWRDRVIGAYGSYWVYQHLGNLSPDQLDDDERSTRRCSSLDNDGRVPAPRRVRVAGRSSTPPRPGSASTANSAAWPWRASRGDRFALLASPRSRRPPNGRPGEWAWVRDAVLQRDEPTYEHLVLASTLPFLMLPGVHHLEGWDEAVAQGAWGRPGQAVRRVVPAVPRPRALGRVPGVVR